MMKYKALILLVFAIITLKLVPYSSPREFGGFWDVNFIIIYDVDKLTQGKYMEFLRHEYQHQLCWDLFGIYPKNVYDHSSRCFI